MFNAEIFLLTSSLLSYIYKVQTRKPQGKAAKETTLGTGGPTPRGESVLKNLARSVHKQTTRQRN